MCIYCRHIQPLPRKSHVQSHAVKSSKHIHPNINIHEPFRSTPFRSTPFRSAPWCFNGHAHTILCSRLFSSPILPAQRIEIPTPDGDVLDLEWIPTTQTNPTTQGVWVDADRSQPDCVPGRSRTPVAILLHGLEGNANRYYIRRLADMLLLDGFDVAALHFRSCSGRMNQVRRFYHSGETEDLATLIRWILHLSPDRPIYLAGFSLGASVILNFLAKADSSSAELHAVQAFAAVSAPFDLKAGSEAMNRGFAQLYQVRFLRSLEKKLQEKRKRYPDLPVFRGNTLYEFDDQVTAALHGFESADDYYHQCSSGRFIDRIRTPGLVLHSKEDPICPFETVPAPTLQEMPYLECVFPDKGGHVGFWSMPAGWQEELVSRYFKRFADPDR